MSDLRVSFIGRPEVAPGFALAGFRPMVVADAEDASRRLGALLGDAHVGLVLIEAPLYEGLARTFSSGCRPVPFPWWSRFRPPAGWSTPPRTESSSSSSGAPSATR